MSRSLAWAAGALAIAAVLVLVWWGWQQGGLALLQLGLGSCL